MKNHFHIIVAALLASTAFAQEKAAGTATPQFTQEQLETKFKDTFKQVTMTGRWCAIKDGKLGPEKEDKYTIVSAARAGGDKWLISTRIKMNQQDTVVPIPVQVKWAGDTAVIIVDKLPYPGGSTYSARVLVYENTYAGTWSGGDRAGLLSGIIARDKE
jgi:hypothetical protein